MDVLEFSREEQQPKKQKRKPIACFDWCFARVVFLSCVPLEEKLWASGSPPGKQKGMSLSWGFGLEIDIRDASRLNMKSKCCYLPCMLWLRRDVVWGGEVVLYLPLALAVPCVLGTKGTCKPIESEVKCVARLVHKLSTNQ